MLEKRLWAILFTAACSSQAAPPPPPPAGKAEVSLPKNLKAVRTASGLGAPQDALRKIVGDGCKDGAHQLDIPIVVNDGENDWVFRDPKYTRFMIPFSRAENLRSLDKLAVFNGAGARLPAQFEVLSRWGGPHSDCGSGIRFAYAHVRATPTPTTVEQWRVKSVPDNKGEMSPLSVQDRSGSWLIDTGVARFELPKDRLQGLGKVTVKNASGKWKQVAKPGRFVLEQPDGVFDAAQGKAWKLELERRGPQVVTVLARGHYPSAKNKTPGRKAKDRGLGYTVRIHFYAGASTVRVEHTYFFGVLAGWNATEATRLTQVKRAFLEVPLVEKTKAVYARMNTNILGLPANATARIEQEKRVPKRPDVYYAIRSKGKIVESGGYGWLPFMAAIGSEHYALATIGRMAVRDPQGITWNHKRTALQVEFTSSPIQVGSARGIWSTAAVDFGAGKPDGNRAYAVQQLAERPLLGTPDVRYLNSTETIGPYAVDEDGPGGRFFDLVKNLHESTRDYLQEYRITGIQLWPDLSRDSCKKDGVCDRLKKGYFAGGDNNYWNWSKPGIDEFFRTGNNAFIYDFSLAEALTFAETITIRPYHDLINDSSVAGLAPCYGSGYGWSQEWIEGLNHRRDNCPADYTYNKTLAVAYIASGDGRLADYFEEAGIGVANIWGKVGPKPQPYLEINLKRLSEQRLENLINGAEFSRDAKSNAFLRKKLREYVDHMLGRALIDGHSCDISGKGVDDARKLGVCWSQQAWMLPVSIAWTVRASRLLQHQGLSAWIIKHGEVSAKNHTVLDGSGLPDIAQARSSSGDNNDNGWRTIYSCKTDKKGVVESTCKKATKGENSLYFYANGMVAYLNVHGAVLGSNAKDPNRICKWLPKAYDRALGGMTAASLNGGVWGKSPGQALGMAAETVGALSRCP